MVFHPSSEMTEQDDNPSTATTKPVLYDGAQALEQQYIDLRTEYENNCGVRNLRFDTVVFVVAW